MSDKIAKLEHDFSSERSDLKGRFTEIQENLALKAHLLQSLSAQLETAQKENQALVDAHQVYH